MYIMVGVLLVGFTANLLIRPVSKRHMEPSAATDGDQRAETETETETERPRPRPSHSWRRGAEQMEPDTSARGAELRGYALWVIVSAGLLYGVVNTARQVVDLFGA